MKHPRIRNRAQQIMRVPVLSTKARRQRGNADEQSLQRMRQYIADGMGCKTSALPGFEASVLSLAVEAQSQRKLIRELHGALEWTSGSSDFAPGGVARKGFERLVRPLLGGPRPRKTTVQP